MLASMSTRRRVVAEIEARDHNSAMSFVEFKNRLQDSTTGESRGALTRELDLETQRKLREIADLKVSDSP